MPAGTFSPLVGCATTSKPGVWAKTALARARTAATEKRILIIGVVSWAKERLRVRELLRVQAGLYGKRANMCGKRVAAADIDRPRWKADTHN